MPNPGHYPLVLHVDMDAFFAAVEARSDPRLCGLPMVVGGGPGDRGVVTAASYPARKFGIRSGMAIAEARRRCPHLVSVPVDGAKMIHESMEVISILDRFCPRVEPASIDEAYLEYPPVDPWRWVEQAKALASRVQTTVLMERGLSCSVGAGTNKLQAKMASGLNKPRGISIVAPGSFAEVFHSKPVSKVPGIGEETSRALDKLGIRTIDQLAAYDPNELERYFGQGGRWLADCSRGVDSRSVLATGETPDPKSAGHEMTFSSDVSDPRVLRAAIWLLADRVSRRLRRSRFVACTVVVRFKVSGRRFSRQVVLDHPTDDPSTLARNAWLLLERARENRALRLVGVAGTRLHRGPTEDPLFPAEVRRRSAVRVGDRLRDRFGERIFLPGEVFRGEFRKPSSSNPRANFFRGRIPG